MPTEKERLIYIAQTIVQAMDLLARDNTSEDRDKAINEYQRTAYNLLSKAKAIAEDESTYNILPS